MKHEDFNFHQHGFVGHLAEPDAGSDRAVIVIMGGEQSLLPGIKFAERFADYGIMGLAVSLFEDANNAGIQRQLNAIEAFLESQQTAIEEYDEALVRKLLERVMVYDDHLTFEFKSGIEIGITM